MTAVKKIILCPESDCKLGLFNDLDTHPDVFVKYVTLKRRWYRWIIKAVNKSRYLVGLNIKIPSFLFDYRIDKMLCGSETVSVIVRSNVLEYVPLRYFEHLRRQGVKCDLLLLDSMDAGSYTIAATRKFIKSEFWDGIKTFDPVDAVNYGFEFGGFHYYSKWNITNAGCREFDVYYIGSFKGNRAHEIASAFNMLYSNEVRCRFDVLISNISELKEAPQGLNLFTKSIPYDSVLDSVSKSGCILEILQENQHGPSLRYFEAVVYNKKLLTNNHDIVNYPYYNPDYMLIFDNVEDIDVEWIQADIAVEYHYKGDFSPLNMLL